MILAETMTGEPFLDWAMNLGMAGFCIFVMYRLMLKNMDKKGVNTQMMMNAAKAFEAIEQRLNSHDTLLKHIMDTQTNQHDTQTQMLRLLERQMALLEQFGTGVHATPGKLDEIKREIHKLRLKLAKPE